MVLTHDLSMVSAQKSTPPERQGTHRDIRFAIRVPELEPSKLGHRRFGASFSIGLDGPALAFVELTFDSRAHATKYAVAMAKQAIDHALAARDAASRT